MNLKEFCKTKGTNIKRLAAKMNVAPSTLYSISSGKTTLDNVGVSLFIDIANALECDTDELRTALTGVDNKQESPQLAAAEIELLEIWRNITPTGQQQLLVFARGCLATHSKNNQLRANQTTA